MAAGRPECSSFWHLQGGRSNRLPHPHPVLVLVLHLCGLFLLYWRRRSSTTHPMNPIPMLLHQSLRIRSALPSNLIMTMINIRAPTTKAATTRENPTSMNRQSTTQRRHRMAATLNRQPPIAKDPAAILPAAPLRHTLKHLRIRPATLIRPLHTRLHHINCL